MSLSLKSLPKVLCLSFLLISSTLFGQTSLNYYGEDTTRNYYPTDIIQAQNGDLLIIGEANSALPLFENPSTKNFTVKTNAVGDTIWTKTEDVVLHYANVIESSTNDFYAFGSIYTPNIFGCPVLLGGGTSDLSLQTRSASWDSISSMSYHDDCTDAVRDFKKNPDGSMTVLTISENPANQFPNYYIKDVDVASNVSNIPITGYMLDVEKASNGYWTANSTTLDRYSSVGALIWQQTNPFVYPLSDFCKVNNDSLFFSYTSSSQAYDSTYIVKTDSTGVLDWDDKINLSATHVFHHSSGNYIITGYRDSSLVTLAVNSNGDSISEIIYQLPMSGRSVKSIEMQNGAIATIGYTGEFWLGVPNVYVLGLDNTFTSYANLNEFDNDLNSISIYPNPSNGQFHIKADKQTPWIVRDLMGKRITSGTENEIDLSNQSPGVYIVQFNIGTNVISKRIILEVSK